MITTINEFRQYNESNKQLLESYNIQDLLQSNIKFYSANGKDYDKFKEWSAKRKSDNEDVAREALKSIIIWKHTDKPYTNEDIINDKLCNGVQISPRQSRDTPYLMDVARETNGEFYRTDEDMSRFLIENNVIWENRNDWMHVLAFDWDDFVNKYTKTTTEVEPGMYKIKERSTFFNNIKIPDVKSHSIKWVVSGSQTFKIDVDGIMHIRVYHSSNGDDGRDIRVMKFSQKGPIGKTIFKLVTARAEKVDEYTPINNVPDIVNKKAKQAYDANSEYVYNALKKIFTVDIPTAGIDNVRNAIQEITNAVNVDWISVGNKGLEINITHYGSSSTDNIFNSLSKMNPSGNGNLYDPEKTKPLKINYSVHGSTTASSHDMDNFTVREFMDILNKIK